MPVDDEAWGSSLVLAVADSTISVLRVPGPLRPRLPGSVLSCSLSRINKDMVMSSPNHTRVCFCLNYKWNSSSRALRDHQSLVGAFRTRVQPGGPESLVILSVLGKFICFHELFSLVSSIPSGAKNPNYTLA